jgi:hypothetical protein
MKLNYYPVMILSYRYLVFRVLLLKILLAFNRFSFRALTPFIPSCFPRGTSSKSAPPRKVRILTDLTWPHVSRSHSCHIEFPLFILYLKMSH